MFQSFVSSGVWRSLPLPPPSAIWPLRPAQGGPRGRLLGGVKRPVSPAPWPTGLPEGAWPLPTGRFYRVPCPLKDSVEKSRSRRKGRKRILGPWL